MKLWMWTLLIVVGITFFLMVSSMWNRGIEVELAQVEIGTIRETIEDLGKTRLTRTYVVTMPFAGKLGEVHFEEGTQVTQGDILGLVDPEELDAEVSAAQAVVEQLRASIVENSDDGLERTARRQATEFVESMASTVAAAETQIEASREKMDFSETVLGRMTQLFERQSTSQEAYDQANLNYVESQVSYRQNSLVVKSVRSIMAATQLMPTLIDDYLQKKALQSEVLQAQVHEAEARLNKALHRQQLGQLRSPTTGIILEQPTDGLEYLAAGTPVCQVGNLNQLEVEVDIMTQDAVRIAPGDAVDLGWTSLPGPNSTSWTGTVLRVDPLGFTKISSLGVEQQRVRVRIELSEATRSAMLEAGIRVGYRLNVSIVVGEVEEGQLIPRTALFRDTAGEWAVFQYQRGRAVKTKVTVGLLGERQAQIIEGLAPNTKVVLSPDQRIQDGSRIKTQRR
jgi:HlyD family secretion protein